MAPRIDGAASDAGAGRWTALAANGTDLIELLKEKTINQIIYIVGAVVIVIAELSFVGLA